MYPKRLWVLAIAATINMTGFSFIWPLTTIYITQVYGRSLSVAGLILMLQAGAGIIGSLLGGTMHDRLGGRTTQMLSASLAACCTLSLALYNPWFWFVFMMICINFLIGMLITSLNAMVGSIWPEGGRKAFNLLYIANNIGVALGCTLGGMVADLSFTYTFAANSLTFVLFLLLIWRGMPAESFQPKAVKDTKQSKKDRPIQRSAVSLPLLLLSIGMMFCFVCYVQWQSTIPVYMKSLGLSLSSYSLLWTINGFLIILIQPFSSVFVQRWIPSLPRQLIYGVLLYVLSFIVLALQESQFTYFVVAMVIMTLGEILVWPGVPAAAAKLASDDNQGFYQGMITGFSYAGRMIGPLIGGYLYDHHSPQVMFTVMITFFLLSLLSFSIYYRVKPAHSTSKKVASPPM